MQEGKEWTSELGNLFSGSQGGIMGFRWPCQGTLRECAREHHIDVIEERGDEYLRGSWNGRVFGLMRHPSSQRHAWGTWLT